MKVATNSEMFARMTEDMDIDAGRILTGGATCRGGGPRDLRTMLAAHGLGRALEIRGAGLGDYEFVPWQIGAVM
jgi:altronate hydrolase